MRGVIYCVHIQGVGHLKRMLTLAKGLVKECEITLIQAGRDEDITFLHPNFRHLKIPLPEAAISIVLRRDRYNFERMMKYRRKQLFALMDFSHHYDFLITDQIPFTKRVFSCEVSSLKSAMEVRNPNLAMICSQKGGTLQNKVPIKLEYQKIMKNLREGTLTDLQKYYDKVLVHCDPQITTLEEMFEYCNEIREMIEYTGYIFPHSHKYPPSNQRKKVILVTTGSGSKGMPLLLTLMQIVTKIPDYHFLFVTSPMMKENIVSLLHRQSQKNSNMEIVNFLDNFDEKLRQSSLAITLGGSTLINLYATGTPGLVCPEPLDPGQLMLGEKFAEHGIVRLIQEKELSTENLYNNIIEILNHPPKSDIELNIAGVENSMKAIRQTVHKKRSLTKPNPR